jgi:hypothetical protein
VERHLTGTENESWEMLYFKVYKSQLAVNEQALEIANLLDGPVLTGERAAPPWSD